MKIATFRPKRKEKESLEILDSLEFDRLNDPLLEFVFTGNKPLKNADYIIFTSTTGIELMNERELDFKIFKSSIVCAIGPKTEKALESIGVKVDIVPEDYSSRGLVNTLSNKVKGKKVEIARSNYGSSELIEGLNCAGGYIHETVLYNIQKPKCGGKEAIKQILDGRIDAVLFTSSLMVEYLLSDLEENRETLIDSLSDCIVGCIGERTKETAESRGIDVDYVPENETFEDLASSLKSFS